jgi:hypothetical protein
MAILTAGRVATRSETTVRKYAADLDPVMGRGLSNKVDRSGVSF